MKSEEKIRKLIHKHKAPFLPYEDSEYAFIYEIIALTKKELTDHLLLKYVKQLRKIKKLTDRDIVKILVNYYGEF